MGGSNGGSGVALAEGVAAVKDGGRVHVSIKAPNLKVATFEIKGTAPLVIHRFSHKIVDGMEAKMREGKSASSKKNRAAVNPDDVYTESRYISPEGWDGFNASAIRAAMVNVCRLVDFKMVLAKMSIFVIPDGYDAKEHQIPLIRIYGTPVKQRDVGRVETGQPYVVFRPCYNPWSAKIRIRWDADQFTLIDITNLLTRVGIQCGIGEGRPFSKDSTGMGWGTFEIADKPQLD